MKNFLFVYRTDYRAMPVSTPETGDGSTQQMEAMNRRWMDWMAGIAAQNKLAEQGNRLTDSGKVVRPNNIVTNGPYAEIKESIGGYSMVKAAYYEDAIELAKDCPILTVGGNVEVREISVM